MTFLLTLLLLADPVLQDRTIVLIFTRTDCPIANRYAPEIERLFETYSPRGLEFLMVYPEAGVDNRSIDHHRAEFGLRLPAVADPTHRYVKFAQATVTPEAAVFLKGRLVYRGRIDDGYFSLSKARPGPTRHDLEDVLRAILSGKSLQFRTAQAIGCAIEKLP